VEGKKRILYVDRVKYVTRNKAAVIKLRAPVYGQGVMYV
jgi:hypothetical protein